MQRQDDLAVVFGAPIAYEDDVERAVQAARRAFESGVWRELAPRERKAILLRFAESFELTPISPETGPSRRLRALCRRILQLQIELNRALYVDEETSEIKKGDFEQLGRVLDRLVGKLGELMLDQAQFATG